jgi:hypothetical protein
MEIKKNLGELIHTRISLKILSRKNHSKLDLLYTNDLIMNSREPNRSAGPNKRAGINKTD